MEEILIHPKEHYLFRAKVIIPVTKPPIFSGCVEIKDQRIVGIYSYKELRQASPKAKFIDLEDLVLFPALANVHTHLELSALRFRILPSGSFINWLHQVIKKRETLTPVEMADSARFALLELWREGISILGDVGNTGITIPVLNESPLRGYFFEEILCFKGKIELKDRQSINGRVKTTYSAHSPYTVTPIMIQAIKSYTRRHKTPFMIHCAESQEEVDFLLRGEGPLVNLLVSRRKWDESFTVKGFTPVSYLESLGVLDENTILVHCVHLTEEDLRILKKRNPIICLCPRSNLYTGAGIPKLPQLLACGLRVVLGTDSLASVDRLSIFEEIKTLHSFYPEVPATELLLMATQRGAKVLGFDGACQLTEGATPDLLAISLSFPLIEDPEKALIEFIRAEKKIVYRIHA
jgi:cytosine/adenosine deaminase-related metal-dependent hydrolase